MSLSEVLERAIGIDATRGSGPEQVFEEVARALAAEGAVTADRADDLAQAFLEREQQGTTAFGFGFAIPHIFHPGAVDLRIAVVRHPSGMDMAALDGQATRCLICVVGPEAQRERYLEVLRFLARITRDRDWRRFMLGAPSAAGVIELLIEAGSTG